MVLGILKLSKVVPMNDQSKFSHSWVALKSFKILSTFSPVNGKLVDTSNGARDFNVL